MKKANSKNTGKTKKATTRTASSGSRSAGRNNGGRSNSEDIKKIFEEELKDIYWAEKHLVKSLPKMVKAASSEELASAFEDHLEQTIEQVARLEQVFEIIGKKPQGKKCEAMEGLVEEAQDIISEHDEGIVRDVALIIAGQKVEHYEMAAYGSLRSLAQVMGESDAVELLQTTLDEEGETNKLLTSISETVNQSAMEDSEGMMEEEEEEEIA